MFQVSVSPDMGMYNLLRSQGYDPAYALAEFVDNAIHALQEHCPERLTKGPQLSVTLRVFSADYGEKALRNSIIIEDDGSGITRKRLIDAFKPAKAVSRRGLSEFGIGMKAAAVWFTDTWSLTTRPIGEKAKYEFKFDLTDLVQKAKDVVDVTESDAGTEPKGTKIVLSGTRRVINKDRFSDICVELTELYQRFTEGSSAILNLRAEFDGTPTELKFKTPDRETLRSPEFRTVGGKVYAVGKEQDWLVPVSFVFAGARVDGQVRLLSKGSYTTNPGLVLFRHNRVIQGTSRQPFVPVRLLSTSNKYGRQRVYGELHLDDLPVSYTKDKFEIDEDQFIDALKQVSGMNELLRQATEYRKADGVKPVASMKALEKLVGKSKIRSVAPAAKAPTKGGVTHAKSPGSLASQPAAARQPAPPPPPYLTVLGGIKGKSSSLVLNSIIEEAMHQFALHRGIAAALCLRIVVEVGVLHKVRRDFPSQYPKVSEKGIKALLNYMSSNADDFFDKKVDHLVIKCVQSNASGTQADVILLNNVSHGHYQPDLPELNQLVGNLQHLLEWAYS